MQWGTMSSAPNTACDPFASWFASSTVRNADGAPLLCHHAGTQRMATFQPFTHFGTLQAAERRASDKRILDPAVHPVFLAINNPIDFLDDEADNNPLRLLDLAVQRRVLDTSQREQLLAGISDAMSQAIIKARTTTEHVSLKWNSGMSLLSSRLLNLGYDGLRYSNRQESGVSFVNFRSNQVWQLGKAMHD